MTHLTGRVKFVSEADGAAARPERGLECPRPAKGRIQVQGQLTQSSWRESGGLFSACAVACEGPGVPTLSEFKTSMEAPPVQSVRPWDSRSGAVQRSRGGARLPARLGRRWGQPTGVGRGVTVRLGLCIALLVFVIHCGRSIVISCG